MKPRKDAYDFVEDPALETKQKPDSGSPFLRLGTIYFLLAAFALIAYFVFIYFNPYHSLNPFPPPPEEAAAAQLTLTETPSPTITPTLESLPEVTETPAPATPTVETVLRPTFTIAYPTPTDVVLMTETPAGTPEARQFYVAQEGSPSYLAYPTGCDGLYVAGNVIDIENDPVMLMTVRASGLLGDQQISLEALSGSSPTYTESGWEIKLSDQLVASTGAITIALYEQGGREPVSEQVVVDTISDCSKNLVVVNFVQERENGN